LLCRTLSKVAELPPDKSEIPWDSAIFIQDIRKPLPFPDACATAVYASRVLERMFFEQVRQFIQEARRALAGGAILPVVVPDLQAIVREQEGERPFGPLPTAVEFVWKVGKNAHHRVARLGNGIKQK
jgi:hypothetical protein